MTLDVVIDANILRPWVNNGAAAAAARPTTRLGAFGPIALYVGGAGEVHFRDVSYRDLSLKRVVAEQLSPNYRMLQLTPFYYSFASAAADFDRDGNMDVVVGPVHLHGTGLHEEARVLHGARHHPVDDFSSNWLEFAGDFTGDGWPDVLLASTSGTLLYVNPKGEPRRWDRSPASFRRRRTSSEVSVMKDVDGDGKPDLVYCSGGAMRWAKPDPAEPDGPVALDAGWRAGHVRGARHRRRRHQRRRPCRHPQRLRMVGTAREGARPGCGRTIRRPSAVRTAAARPAAPRCACTTSTATSSTMS